MIFEVSEFQRIRGTDFGGSHPISFSIFAFASPRFCLLVALMQFVVRSALKQILGVI